MVAQTPHSRQHRWCRQSVCWLTSAFNASAGTTWRATLAAGVSGTRDGTLPHAARASSGIGTTATDRHLLRDAEEHVPQPGYIGSNYDARRVLLVGQNPAIPGVLAAADLPYTAALRPLRDEPSVARYRELSSVLESFVPRWPVHGSYFPLQECGLTLQDIAHCNIVRCRTVSVLPRHLDCRGSF